MTEVVEGSEEAVGYRGIRSRQMPRIRTIPASEAEANTEETQAFIQRVRRVTRRKFTPEEKVRVVLEGFRRETRVSDLCRREGINPNVYYAWLKEFMEAGKARLAAETMRDATQAEVEGLKQQNERLKQLVAELSLEVLVLKKTAIPEFR
jgi:transposase